ncbi:MAG: hypothetical protein PHN74_03045 [Candidatus Pacebacteria bacterium]|nr:hypothetical protein [Candidatus Paceibacterota bacterium]
MVMTVGVIGAGNIGEHLIREKLAKMSVDVRFIMKDDGIYKNMTEKVGELHGWRCWHSITTVDVVFLAIPTLDDGKIASEYMDFFLSRGIRVITCEKGAMSNYFDQVAQWRDMIGYSAAVGGGTRLLKHLKLQISSDTEEIHAVLNGTLNFIFSEISLGRSFGEVVEEARRLRCVEPGAKDPLEIINKEAALDIPMKTAILLNVLDFGGRISFAQARNIQVKKVKEEELNQLLKQADKFRYIVSVAKSNHEEPCIGGFKYKIGSWNVSGGFKKIESNSLYNDLVINGVNNAFVVSEGKYGKSGRYRFIGPGAEPEPTTSAMMKDFADFCYEILKARS